MYINKLILFCSLFLGIVGCSIFTDYPGETSDARNAFYGGNFDYALQRYNEESQDSLIRVLALLEAGTVAHTAGRYGESKNRFSQAEALMDEFENRAKISASESAEGLGAVTVNDKTMPYEGMAFEKVMLKTYQAFNYLMEGGPQDALVEIKGAQNRQNQAYDQYVAEIERDQNQAVSGDYQGFVTDFRQKFNDTSRSAAGKYGEYNVASDKNVFQIAGTYYLSSIIYEMLGDVNDSYIDLKRLYTMNPSFYYGKLDYLRACKKLGFQDEMRTLEGAGLSASELPPDEYGSVVVFFQCDEAPMKEERSFTIPTGGAGFQKIAWPVYVPSRTYATHLDLDVNGQTASTETLSDMNAISIRYFIEYSRARIIRTAVRIAAKIIGQKATEAAVRESSGDGWGALAGLTASAIASYTEQADLRSWLTLPRSFQACRLYLPPGQYSGIIKVKNFGGGTIRQIDLGPVKIEAKKIKVVVARSLGSQVYFDMYPNN